MQDKITDYCLQKVHIEAQERAHHFVWFKCVRLYFESIRFDIALWCLFNTNHFQVGCSVWCKVLKNTTCSVYFLMHDEYIKATYKILYFLCPLSSLLHFLFLSLSLSFPLFPLVYLFLLLSRSHNQRSLHLTRFAFRKSSKSIDWIARESRRNI